jgi:hypothetical protein
MERSLDQVEFQAKNICDLEKLLQRRIRLTALEVRQSAQGNTGQLGDVALT